MDSYLPQKNRPTLIHSLIATFKKYIKQMDGKKTQKILDLHKKPGIMSIYLL